ncbi:hypothetical protein EJB05_44401, partial [Eragrostis curvula]
MEQSTVCYVAHNAGRLDSNLKSKGDILINGRRQKLAFGTSAYVTQENMLMATLTVREAIYYSAQIQLPDTMSVAEKLSRADDTIQEMGLTSALDTRIGGRETKGISGGQRKRLSICLEILTRPRLLFLDEPTSGLDSAASFHVMSRIAGLAAREGMTILAVVHQPCSEVFELFHGLCLLASGKTIFFGPAANAAAFFTSNGYPCPPMRNPSDHFLRTINRDFEMECGGGSESKPSAADEAIEILVSAYKRSNTSEIVKREMHDINEMGGEMIRRNQASFLTKVVVLSRRSFVNMYRDVGYYWLRLGIYIAICARSSMLMFIGSLLTLMAIGGFPSFVEDMKLPSNLPKIMWKYPVSYISFHKYALQGFYKNEFLGLVLENNQGGGNTTITGEEVITKLFEVETGHSKWVDLAVLCGMIVAYRILFVVIVMVLDVVKPMFKGAKFRRPVESICVR